MADGLRLLALHRRRNIFHLTREKDGKTSTLLISRYVDDGACCTYDEILYQEFLQDLRSKYKVSNAGDFSWHLGINIVHYHDASTIALDQAAYTNSILRRFNMQDCNEAHIPLPPKVY